MLEGIKINCHSSIKISKEKIISFSAKFFSRLFGIKDNPKETKLFGKELAGIFPEIVFTDEENKTFSKAELGMVDKDKLSNFYNNKYRSRD